MPANLMESAWRAHSVAVMLSEYTDKRRDGAYQYKSGDEVAIVAAAARILVSLTSDTVAAALGQDGVPPSIARGRRVHAS